MNALKSRFVQIPLHRLTGVVLFSVIFKQLKYTTTVDYAACTNNQLENVAYHR